MKTKRDDANTASAGYVADIFYRESSVLDISVTVVPNNHRPILGTMSEAETVTLALMLDRLDNLEEAIRVRPNARAIAAFRESVAIDVAMAADGDQAERLAAQCGAILLDMLDKIMAVKS